MRFYRLLLRFYPTSFRAEYGDELASVFAARRAGASGLFGAIITGISAVADVVPNAIAAHWDILQQDLRYTARALRRAPGFAITAVLVVALGVGANTAAFSVAGFVLLRPLPFPEPSRLMKLWERLPGYPQMEVSPANYRDWKASAKSFSRMGAYNKNAVNLVAGNEPRRLEATRVTADLLPVLGVRPIVGRLFTASDTVAGRSVILSYDLWQTQFGGDRAVVGTHIDLDGRPYDVVGVMPRGFHFPDRGVMLWQTMQFSTQDFEDRADNYLNIVARLGDGVALETASAELTLIAARLEREYPKANEKTGATVYRLSEEMSQRTKLLLYGLCGAALCTLLLACANLASLLLARAVGREREIAVRAALGAGRERIARQLVTESVVLAVIGGIAGVLVAIVAVPGLAFLVPMTLPVAQEATVDLRVLAFAGALVALTGLAFGVVPAVRSGGSRAIAGLRDSARAGGGRKQRVRAVLVMVEVMASVALLTSSGLLVRAMWEIQRVDPGFQTEGILTLQTALPAAKYGAVLTREQFYARTLSDVRAIPGVTSAAYISGLPMVWRGGIWAVSVRGREVIRDAANSASFRMATPQFFASLGIPLRKGRDVSETDDATRPFVAVVSESFVKRYFPNEDPIGKQFNFVLSDRTIVGVVADIRVRGLERPSEPQVYVPSKQVADNTLFYYAPKYLVIRSSVSTSTLLPEIRRIVHAADPRQPISDVQTMGDIVANETASRVAQLRVLGILAGIALLLASVGLHGLLSFTVSRRSQEIGVRVALGAESRRILRMVLREGLLLAIGGLIPGIALAYWAGRGMEALLAGIGPADPTTFVSAVTICVAMSLIGCLRPALRASRVDPATALRAE